MARFTLTAHRATFDGIWVTIHYGFLASPNDPKHFVIPSETIEAKTTAAALDALTAFADKARAKGEPCSCSITLDRRDRAPNGWKKARTRIDINPADDTATMVCAAE